ncbi:MAG TPA: cytochrome c [Clostridia bacterium]|nr:cytochrome c [Clostridia bacterium]
MSETAEPKAGRIAVPVWLIILLLMLLYWGMFYFDQRSGWGSPQVYVPYRSLEHVQLFQPATGGADLARGRAVYENVCALCHNTDGSGKPGQAPPLAGSEWVVGNPNHMIRIPLSGLSGPIQVKGQEWNLAMPAMGAALSDEDLAAALTYMRKSWGNNASEITAEQVNKIRAEVGNRTQPWTAAELNNLQ